MELWDLVDGNRIPTGQIHERGVAVPTGCYHIVVDIFTINADGKLLLTQRDPVKTYPFLWEMTGGSVTSGETSLVGALRELEEETGLAAAAHELIKLGESKQAHYFRDSYIWKSKKLLSVDDLTLQPMEVCNAKFVSLQEFEEMQAQELLIPGMWQRFKDYQKVILQLMDSAPVADSGHIFMKNGYGIVK